MTNQPHPQPEFVPEWAKGIVWYQIFPERFRNGDPNNDPTIDDIQGAYPHGHNPQWQIHPWTADWYAQQPYEQHTSESIWTHLQRRRYGGDLQGILDSLDYLADLGIGAIYLNPIFQSPVNHRYETSDYLSVDRYLGSNDEFAAMTRQLKAGGIRTVLDGVFNHCATDYPPFKDLRDKGVR